eukprot:209404-Chlamydomonas_euryale.AAC.1
MDEAVEQDVRGDVGGRRGARCGGKSSFRLGSRLHDVAPSVQACQRWALAPGPARCGPLWSTPGPHHSRQPPCKG